MGHAHVLFFFSVKKGCFVIYNNSNKLAVIEVRSLHKPVYNLSGRHSSPCTSVYFTVTLPNSITIQLAGISSVYLSSDIRVNCALSASTGKLRATKVQLQVVFKRFHVNIRPSTHQHCALKACGCISSSVQLNKHSSFPAPSVLFYRDYTGLRAYVQLRSSGAGCGKAAHWAVAFDVLPHLHGSHQSAQ